MNKGSPRDPRPRSKAAGPLNAGPFAPSSRGKSHDDSQRAFAGKPDRRHYGQSSYRSFAIVHQDEHIVAVTKPDGLLVTMAEDGEQTLQDQVKRHVRKVHEPDACDPAPVHRLDRYTSGLVLFGRTKRGLDGLSRLIRDGEMRKEYYALVVGTPREKHFQVDAPLREYADGKKRVTVASHGDHEAQDAVSEVTVEEVLPGCGLADSFSLVRVGLMTGRTHQIRVHMAHIGHPICGDTIYGLKGPNRGLREQGKLFRQFLHARRLAFEHPITGMQIDLEAKLPKDLVVVLKFLREGGKPAVVAKKKLEAKKVSKFAKKAGAKPYRRRPGAGGPPQQFESEGGRKPVGKTAKTTTKKVSKKAAPKPVKVRPPKPKKGDKPPVKGAKPGVRPAGKPPVSTKSSAKPGAKTAGRNAPKNSAGKPKPRIKGK